MIAFAALPRPRRSTSTPTWSSRRRVYAEKEGTVTHPDGRLQRVRQALGHPGEARARLVGARRAVRAARRRAPARCRPPAVTALVAEAVPFYAGLTLDEIGGRGRALAGARGGRRRSPAAELLDRRRSSRAAGRARGPALGAAPTLWTGPRSSTRRRCASSTPARARSLSAADAARDSASSERRRGRASSADGDERRAPRSSCAPACPTGSVFLIAARAGRGAGRDRGRARRWPADGHRGSRARWS